MLTLRQGYARLAIERDEEFASVSESIRSLLHVCRMNGLAAALVVSRQNAFDWRSSVRIGIRFAASRAALQGLRLALVADHFNDGARTDVLAVAQQVGLDCGVFRAEGEALVWLGVGPGKGGPIS